MIEIRKFLVTVVQSPIYVRGSGIAPLERVFTVYAKSAKQAVKIVRDTGIPAISVRVEEVTTRRNVLPAPKEPWQMLGREYATARGYKKSQGSRVLSNWLAQHEAIVLVARQQGKPVPPEVLAEYPRIMRYSMRRSNVLPTRIPGTKWRRSGRETLSKEERAERYHYLRSLGYSPSWASAIRDYYPWNYRKWATLERAVEIARMREKNPWFIPALIAGARYGPAAYRVGKGTYQVGKGAYGFGKIAYRRIRGRDDI